MKAGFFLVSLAASIVLATTSPSEAQLSDELHGHWELAVSMDYVEPSHTIYPPEERQHIRISADSLYVWGPGIPGELSYAIAWDGPEYWLVDFVPGEASAWPAASECQPTVAGEFVGSSWYPFPVELPCEPDPCLRVTPVGCTDGGIWLFVREGEVSAAPESLSALKARF